MTAPEPGSSSPHSTGREAVLLLHGLGSPSLLMFPLARFLEKAGYEVVNWGYPSTRRKLAVHAEQVMPVLRRLDEAVHLQRVHLVTHSMGGIVARTALQRQPLQKPGRFVMIGPPNRGTPLASKFSWLLAWLFLPVPELADHPNSFVNALQPPQCMETGVIAARHDFIVPLVCTQLSGQCDHIVIQGRHVDILFRRETAEQVLAFLRTGHFIHADREACAEAEKMEREEENGVV